MRKIITIAILLIVCLVQQAKSQGNKIDYRPDSLRIEFPEHECLVVLEMKNYSTGNNHVKDFPKLLAGLLEQVEKSMPVGFSETGPYRIDINITHEQEDALAGVMEYNFRPIGEKTDIRITQPDPETKVRVKESQIVELKPPGWEVVITTKKYQATVYAARFTGLKGAAAESFDKVIETLNKNPDAKDPGRKSLRSRTVVKDGDVISESVSFVTPLDMLSLNATGGLGLVNERFFPELGITAGFEFSDRYNRPRVRLELGYQNLFLTETDPEGGYKAKINSFATLSYGMNFNKGTGRPNWTGIGAGYLVKGRGDIFKGNTMKFYFFNEIGSSRIQVVPEFYLTDDFKKFTFGMTLRYTF